MDEAWKQLKRLVSKTITVTHASMESHPKFSRRVEVLDMKAYGTETHSLLDAVAVPLAPMSTDRQVTVADRTFAEIFRCVQKVPVPFGTLVVPLGFLVVRNVPLDAIIGSSILESMQPNLNY